MSAILAIGRLTLGDVAKSIRKRLGATEVEPTLVSLSSLCSTALQRLDRLISSEVGAITAPTLVEVVRDLRSRPEYARCHSSIVERSAPLDNKVNHNWQTPYLGLTRNSRIRRHYRDYVRAKMSRCTRPIRGEIVS